MKKTDIDIEHLKTECEEWKSKYLRALADYQNLEKRFAQQKEDLVLYATKQLGYKILSAFDVLEKAEKHIKDEGLNFAIKAFQDVFKNEHIEPFEVLGKQFDPISMECIEVVESEKDGEVLEELQKGYMLKDKILRVAHVKVGKKSESKNVK